MVASTSKQLVEARYGQQITDDEYRDALEYATMKLNFQSGLFHRDFDTDYVTTVVVEIINQNRVDQLYAEIDQFKREALAAKRTYEETDALGIRKGLSEIAAHSGHRDNGNRTFSDYPHCITNQRTIQYMGV